MTLALKILAVWVACGILAAAAIHQAHRWYRWRGWEPFAHDMGWGEEDDRDWAD